MRRTLLLGLAAVLAAGCAGCAGWMRPLAAADGEHLVLLLSGKRMGSPDPETTVYAWSPEGSGGWVRLAELTGAARSAVLWKGELWVLFPESCSRYRLKPDGLERLAVTGLSSERRASVLAVHEGALWILAADQDGFLTAARLTRPDGAWERLPFQLELGRAAGQFRAVSARDGLWVLWRKDGGGGRPLPETFSARYSGGRWEYGQARALGGAELAACPAPGGDGLLVVASRGAGSALSGRELAMSRLTLSSWDEPKALGIPPREFGSALLGLALAARPAGGPGEGAELLLFSGCSEGAALHRATLDAPGAEPAWRRGPVLEMDLRGPEVPLMVMLFLAAVAVGSGLGVAAVRRTRIFPVLPGEAAPAPVALRAAAWALDNLLVGAVFYAVLETGETSAGSVLRHEGMALLLAVSWRLAFCFYCAVFEARWAATPGKLVFSLRVAMVDGSRPTARGALVRNVVRLIDEALLFPLPGVVAALLSRRAQRLGDVFARTVVTTARSVQEVSEDRRRKSDRFGKP